LLSEKVIPPNGEGEVKVTYNSGRRKGQQSKTVYVHSNDPEQPKLALKVKGQVKEAVVCSPTRLEFGKVVQGESSAKQVTVTPGEGEKAKVKSVEVTSEYLSADFSETTAGDTKGYVIDVTLSPDAPRGRLSSQLKIETDNEHAPIVTVSVMATVTGEIVTTPDRLSLILQAGEENKSSVVSVNKMRGGPFTISKVECDVEHVTTDLQTVEKGKRYKVQVNGDPHAPICRANGTITIHTDDRNDPTIDIPLTFVVRGNLSVVPEQLSLGAVDEGQELTKVVTVMTKQDELTIKKVESTLDFLTTEVVTKETGKQYTINVTVKGDAPVGPIQGKLIIHTSDSLQPKVEVHVTGHVRSRPAT